MDQPLSPDLANQSNYPPIFNLDHDILWRVFSINTMLHDQKIATDRDWMSRPFTVLLFTSQVCHNWRELILQTPSLWGSVIDLDILALKHSHFRSAVMIRTGQSLLCINGTAMGGHTASRQFFTHLLDMNWTRIRRLDVDVTDRNRFIYGMWDIFHRPAPYLECFKLSSDCSQYTIFSSMAGPLFANNAPSLREFDFPFTSRKNFNLQVSWISQLRTLVLARPLPVNKVLEALTRMHFLESLEIQDLTPGPTDQSYIPATIPFLHRLRITSMLKSARTLLQNIIPENECVLILTTIDTQRGNVTDPELDEFCQVVSRYTEGYFNNSISTSLTLSLSYRTFSFWTPVLEKFDVNDVEFLCDIYFDFPLPDNAIPKFLGLFSLSIFCHITSFEFNPDQSYNFEPIQSNIHDFFALLPSVKNLTASEYGLQVLSNLKRDGTSVFPSLGTLTFQTQRKMSRSFAENLLRFLEWRRKVGLALGLLDITNLMNEGPCDWGYLEVVEGLKVIRTQADMVEEYLCGSGMPEKLDLR